MSKKSESSEAVRLALMIAHQLKSPITSLGNVLQMLLTGVGGSISPRQRELLEKAFSRCTESITAAQRLLSITKALERPETLRGVVNIGLILQQAIIRHTDRAEQQQIHLESRIDPQVEWACGDPDAFSEVIDVLLDNALKYTPSHGLIRVLANRDKDTWKN